MKMDKSDEPLEMAAHYFRCFPNDHMLKGEELKPEIRVWIKHYKLTFRTISKCRHSPFSVDFFRFQTIDLLKRTYNQFTRMLLQI